MQRDSFVTMLLEPKYIMASFLSGRPLPPFGTSVLDHSFIQRKCMERVLDTGAGPQVIREQGKPVEPRRAVGRRAEQHPPDGALTRCTAR